MLSFKLTLTNYDTTMDKLNRVAAVVNDQEEINAVVSVAVEALVKAHLTENYATKPNWLGAPSTGFWKRAIESVDSTSDGTVATTSITGKGVALRYYGGVVRPSGRTSEVTGKPIKFLAFPVAAEVYGKAVAEVGFKLYPGGKSGPGLYKQQGDAKSDSDPKMFAFARKTTHQPDPEILPSTNKILDAVSTALGDLMEAATEG